MDRVGIQTQDFLAVRQQCLPRYCNVPKQLRLLAIALLAFTSLTPVFMLINTYTKKLRLTAKPG